MAIRLTITGSTNNNIAATDIRLVATDVKDITGTAAATALQATIRAAIGAGADLTMAWANFKFTLDAIDAAATITIEAPISDSYFDATHLIFGTTGTGTQTFEGEFPEDCTVYADLPDDFYKLTAAMWDKFPLTQLPHDLIMKPDASGSPRYYSIVGAKMYLAPTPIDQKEFYIEYKAIPADIALTAFDTNISSVIPDTVQPAITYWVASELLKGNYEEVLAQQRMKDYEKVKSRYMVNVSNQNTESASRQVDSWLWYRVKV